MTQPGLINYREFITKLDEVFSEAMNPTEVITNARTTAVSYKKYENHCIEPSNLSKIQIGVL